MYLVATLPAPLGKMMQIFAPPTTMEGFWKPSHEPRSHKPAIARSHGTDRALT